ncbi:hypothetical protein SRABI98_03397 [Microbacterium sp. Bi98]|uniref:DUF1428 domain-containing protein n=1 Tax=Microbacterium sp. Bi98 TaxID=2821116 RepID=UPI001D64789F|nr:DUF1428 family protein [Microbacterium sp. Bi98]CAH0256743.1 hypothetical protein SRABI98_03397 [Microbacterium sp. Bi98]
MVIADITVVPVPTERKAAYLDFSKRMAEVYRDHGAISVVDYWQSSESADPGDFHADGTSYEPGELKSIADLSGTNAGESVVVTVMTWPSREVRDRGTAAATRDARVLETLDEEPVFDGGRVIGDSFEIAMSVQRDE